MSLLLKSLQQIDSRLPPIAAVSEPAIPPAPILAASDELTPMASASEPATAMLELPSCLPEFPAVELEETAHETTIAEEAVADVFDPIEPPLQPVESISQDALFAVPLEPELPKPVEPSVSPPPQAELTPPALLMTATVNETVSDPAPIVTDAELNFETVQEDISNLEELLLAEMGDAQILSVIEPVPAAAPSTTLQPRTIQPSSPQPLNLSDEYRELRDHFLSRFSLESHTTLLLVDAGRIVTDASWLMPFVTSLLEHLTKKRLARTDQRGAPLFGNSAAAPTALLIEAAGADCGLARSFGLDVKSGLSDVLRDNLPWKSALQPTVDPQIHWLGRGSAPLLANQGIDLAALLADLKEQFDLVVVAAGPLDIGADANRPLANSAALFLPLASAAILCVELDGTPQQTAATAKRKLVQRGVNLLGCIVRGDSAA